MDQQVSDRSSDDERLEQIVSALRRGFILIDSDGRVAWMDDAMRRKIDGNLRDLVLPIRRSEGAIDCFVTTVDVTLDGEQQAIAVIQAVGDRKEGGLDLVAAIETIMSDTSWFTRTIIDKLRALPQASRPTASASDLDLLTEREREILALICEGRSDADMGRLLNLSQNTVRNHVASLYRKIGVNRRSAAVIWARERAITSQEVLAARARRRTRPGRPQGKE